MNYLYSLGQKPGWCRGLRRFALLGVWALLPLSLQAAPAIRLEAESGLLRNLRPLSSTPGFTGTGYAGNFEQSDAQLTFRFPAAAGSYRLTLRYTSPFGPKEYQLAVNGEESGYTLPGPAAGFQDSEVGRFKLQAGENTITIRRGWGYFGLDYLELTPDPANRPAAIVPLVNGRAEAELGTLTGVQTVTTPAGFSGTGFVSEFDAATDQVSIQIDNPKAGLYQLGIGYTSPFGEKGYDLQVNGTKSSGLFAQTGADFRTAEAGLYLLPKGLNTITIRRGWGYFGIDFLQLTPATAALPAPVPGPLTNANASASAQALLTFLRGQYGTKVLAGQHAGPEDKLADLHYILTKTGKEPALASFDLIEYSPSRVENGSRPAGYSEQFLAWARKGQGRGIVSLMWHWNAPTDLINSPTNPWWRGFYTDASTFDIAAVLADKSGSRYQLLLRDIDTIAAELKKFQEANIPVLWRPLHEAEGAWFWWGAQGAAPYKELWHLLYERLTTHHQLHNLIWVYACTQSASPGWYPGDAYVDIAGLDLYLDASANMSSDWAGQQVQLGGKKLVALAESGNLPDPDNIRGYATWWSWFTIWQGKDWIQHQPEALLKRVYNDPDIITLDELPNWKGTVTATKGNLGPEALAVYPNPASGLSLNASLTLPAPQQVLITLSNSLGQPVHHLRTTLPSGPNFFQLPISNLSGGLYLLTVQGPTMPLLSRRVLIEN
ncbi:hypothetical protein GCM10027346_36680 [Hymenobacter seoulensis]